MRRYAALFVLAAAATAIPARACDDPAPPGGPAHLFTIRDDLLGMLRQSPVAATNQRSVSMEGSPARLVLWDENGDHSYAISLDGRHVDVVRETSYDILLRFAEFDPLKGEPAVPAALSADAGSGVRIVQFVTQPLPEYRAAIEAMGGTVGAYLGNHAYIVRIDPAAAVKVAAQRFVRWVGPMHPAYRLDEPFVAVAAGTEDSKEASRRYSILALPRDMGRLKGDTQSLANAISALGGKIEYLVPDGDRLEASLTSAQLRAAAHLDDVLFIDRWEPPTTYMDNVRTVGGANDVERIAGFTGAGVRAEVMDTNLFNTHGDFQRHPALFHGARAGDASHGTSVFGIVFGTGVGNGQGRGMLPDAQGIFADFGNLTNRAAHTAELNQAPYFAVFQTNSWGSCCFTAYTTQAADIDNILFQNDFLLLQAQANTGNNTSDVIAFAKNLVSVGGIRHRNTASLTDDAWQAAGSIGPAVDGRIKPDLAFWYDAIFTTAQTGGYTSDFGGTSAATPMTAGHFGLFYQMWSAGIFGNTVTPGATVFENRPHMTTAKAMMVNSASPYGFLGSTSDLTRTHQGWGRADVRRLYDLRDKFMIVNETDVLGNLGSRTYRVFIAPGTPEFRSTLVYADPPGAPNSTRHRVNDLTLSVTAPDGTLYWGNNGLRNGNISIPGGTANTVDTVENVWVTNPPPGRWTIRVVASEIVRDQHLETPEVDADYALVVSGVSTPCAVDFNADGSRDPDDLADFITCYLLDALTPGACPEADFNADTNRDPDDLAEFITAFFTQACP